MHEQDDQSYDILWTLRSRRCRARLVAMELLLSSIYIIPIRNARITMKTILDSIGMFIFIRLYYLLIQGPLCFVLFSVCQYFGLAHAGELGYTYIFRVLTVCYGNRVVFIVTSYV